MPYSLSVSPYALRRLSKYIHKDEKLLSRGITLLTKGKGCSLVRQNTDRLPHVSEHVQKVL
jgi:hypothetical protein